MEQEFKTTTIDGEAYFLEPWANQRGTKYGPSDYDQYEVVLVNPSAEEVAKIKELGRNPTIPKKGKSKEEAGIKEYYQINSRYKIPIADSKTNPIEDGTFIPNGSKIRVYVQVRPLAEESEAGNTSKLVCQGVQIIEMAEMPDDGWEPSEVKSVFETVEGGYEREAKNDTPFKEVLPDEDPLS